MSSVKLLIKLFFILLVASCYSNKDKSLNHFKNINLDSTSEYILNVPAIDSSETIDLHLNNLEEKGLYLSRLIKDVEYIPLKLPSNDYIGEARILKIFNNSFYLLDPYITNNLYVFNENGEFRYKLHNHGKGPLEYNLILDFTYIPESNELVIFDDKGSKLIFIDNSNGKPIKEQKLYYRISNIDYNNGSNLFLLSGMDNDNRHLPEINKYQAFITDTTFIAKKGFSKKLLNDRNDFNLDSHQILVDDKLFFKPRYKNRIYEICSSNLVKLKYRLKYSKHEIDSKFYAYETKEFLSNIKKSDKLYFFGEFLELNNLSIFILEGYRKSQYIFYNKLTGEISLYNKFILDNPKIPIFSFPITSYKNNLYAVSEAYNFEKVINNYDKLKDFIPENIFIKFKNITRNDNPVIIKYEINNSFE